MTFFSGNTDMDALVDVIADQLIATGAWVDADPFYPAGAHPAKRVVAHATDANLYLWFARQQVNAPLQGALKWNEIVCIIASGYNLGTHAVTGTTQTTGIPCEYWQTGASGYPYYWNTSTGSGNKTGQYWLWVDVTGITLLATWTQGTGYDYSSFLAIERNTAKEYADGFTNIFVTAITNSDPDNTFYNGTTYYGRYFLNRSQGGNPTYSDMNRAGYARPFNLVDPAWTNGVAYFFSAYKSPGNSKVYFEFPVYSNNASPSQRSPIATAASWFYASVSLGIADGDLVTYTTGPNTYTYLVKTLQSPDSAAFLTIAMRQA